MCSIQDRSKSMKCATLHTTCLKILCFPVLSLRRKAKADKGNNQQSTIISRIYHGHGQRQ